MIWLVFFSGSFFGICAFVLVLGFLVETKRIPETRGDR